MHHTVADLTISKAGDSNTGAISVNKIEGAPFVIRSTSAEGFKTRVVTQPQSSIHGLA